MATKPNCPQCGYKMKSLYQRVGAKATYTRLDKWYYCQRDNWVMNPSNPTVMSDIIKALDPKYRQVNVSSLNENEIRKMLLDPFVRNKDEIIAYLEQAEIILDLVLNDADEDIRFMALAKLDAEKFSPTLEYVAINDPSPKLRLYTANLLNNNEFYAALALNDEEEYIRKLMLNRLDNPVIIEQMALEDKKSRIRWDALRKLINLHEIDANIDLESIALQIFQRETSKDIQGLALPFILNEEELKKLVYKDNSHWITWSILEKIKDEDFLMKVFMDETLTGKGGAIRNIHNQDFLRDLIQTTENSDHFEIAVQNLNDKKLLRQIALDTSIQKFYSESRIVAARKLGDKELIWDMIQTDPDMDVRAGLIYSITDQVKLESLLFSELPTHLRLIALRGIKDQTIYIKAAKTSPDADIRKEAVKRIDDLKILKKIYYENIGTDLWEVRNHLVEKLSDQKTIQKIIDEEPNETVRISALEKLTDKLFLSNLSMNDQSDRVRLAAENRSVRLSTSVSGNPLSMPILQGNPEFIRKIKHHGISPQESIFQPGRSEGSKLLSCPNCQFVVSQGDPTCTNCGELMPAMKQKLGSRYRDSTAENEK